MAYAHLRAELDLEGQCGKIVLMKLFNQVKQRKKQQMRVTLRERKCTVYYSLYNSLFHRFPVLPGGGQQYTRECPFHFTVNYLFTAPWVSTCRGEENCPLNSSRLENLWQQQWQDL